MYFYLMNFAAKWKTYSMKVGYESMEKGYLRRAHR
jgi:hypothetical protein